ncbi:MAG: ABC transporter ATP-binding protein, partial [Dactylosporangium sp.]|nr:ABC transporter ATP-binding protein [Dactylosporangium sp.]
LTPAAVTPAGTDLPAMAEGEAADLLAWLVAKQVRVVAFAPTHNQLESTYLALTQERR